MAYSLFTGMWTPDSSMTDAEKYTDFIETLTSFLTPLWNWHSITDSVDTYNHAIKRFYVSTDLYIEIRPCTSSASSIKGYRLIVNKTNMTETQVGYSSSFINLQFVFRKTNTDFIFSFEQSTTINDGPKIYCGPATNVLDSSKTTTVLVAKDGDKIYVYNLGQTQTQSYDFAPTLSCSTMSLCKLTTLNSEYVCDNLFLTLTLPGSDPAARYRNVEVDGHKYIGNQVMMRYE